MYTNDTIGDAEELNTQIVPIILKNHLTLIRNICLLSLILRKNSINVNPKHAMIIM
jgi:hypothetical protein